MEDNRNNLKYLNLSQSLIHRISTRESRMTHYDEKREHVRYDLATPIVYAFQDSDQFKPAQLCNYCRGGMCFKTVDAIDPGSDIYIMMEDFLPDSIDAEFYDGYLAEVRWCRKPSSESAGPFFVGVRYYQTEI